MLDAAKAMKLSAKDLLQLNVIDEIIEEPLGGAHRDKEFILDNVNKALTSSLITFRSMSADEIYNDRKNKFIKIGRSKGFVTNTDELSNLNVSKDQILRILKYKKTLYFLFGFLILVSLIIIL